MITGECLHLPLFPSTSRSWQSKAIEERADRSVVVNGSDHGHICGLCQHSSAIIGVTYIGLGGQRQERLALDRRRRTHMLFRGRNCSSRRQ